MNGVDMARAALQEKRGPTSKENPSNKYPGPQDTAAHLVQVRRRREASYRLPEYSDRLRDPLDGLAGRCPSRRSIAGAYFHLFDLGLMSQDMHAQFRQQWRCAA